MKKIMSVMLVIALALMTTCSFAYSGIKADPVEPAGFGGVAGTIIGVMKWIGYAIAVGMLVYIGIKYVMGSADEKANLKGSLIKYIIGALLIVFAVTIADAIFSIK